MAFWNAPLEDDMHVRKSCLASLEMSHCLKELNKTWQIKKFKSIKIGIAIHSGLVRVGNMGSDQRFDYTVIGDTVNLTSRLENLTKMYGTSIIVSDAVVRSLRKNDFVFRELDRVRVKGKEKAITIYELLGEKKKLKEEKLHELAEFEQARAAYYQGDFRRAYTKINQLIQNNSDSPLYHLYSERCAMLINNPPPSPWEGIFTMTSK